MSIFDNCELNIMPGDILIMWDKSLYIDDKKTPYKTILREALVLKRYGTLKTNYPITFGPYKDLIDVKFLHNGRVSRGHFTNYLNFKKEGVKC